MKIELCNWHFVAGIALLVAGHASAQNLVVSTIANDFEATASAPPGVGPAGIAVDSSGNLYVADPINNIIEKLSPTGVLQTIAGQSGQRGSENGPAATAHFNGPTGLDLDAAGDIFVADQYNSTIRKITPAGIVSTLAGTPNTFGSRDGPGSSATFSQPTALAIDAAGNIYVADAANVDPSSPSGPSDLVRKIDSNGNVTTVAQIPAPDLYNLQGIAVDRQGDIFVSIGAFDSYWYSVGFPVVYGDAIYEVSTGGTVSVFAGQPEVNGANDGIGVQAQFHNPGGLAVDSGGNLYVADKGNYTIREITPAGVVTTVGGLAGYSGSVDGPGSQARLSGPEALAVDASGNVFISDGRTVRRGIPAINTQSPVRLINLSARSMVAPSSPLIGGFVIEGSCSQTVLARGVGPTLAQFGVSNPLQAPQLDIYAQGGVLVASSANGINTTNSASAAALVGAFPLPEISADAPLVITLKPGAYTAVVSSPNGASGTALVEVYEIP